MLKVTKFGGSSMADAGQYRKIRDILLADPARRVVVVSAAGKRDKNDHKITDLLYLCYSHVKYGVDCDRIFQMIASRYIGIRNELGLALAIEPELEALKKDQIQISVNLNGYKKGTHQVQVEVDLSDADGEYKIISSQKVIVNLSES